MFSIRHLCALLVLLMAAAPAVAQDTDTSETAEAQGTATAAPVRNGARFGAWTVTCEALGVNETACVLSQTLVRSSDDRFLAEILAFFFVTDRAPLFEGIKWAHRILLVGFSSYIRFSRSSRPATSFAAHL